MITLGINHTVEYVPTVAYRLLKQSQSKNSSNVAFSGSDVNKIKIVYMNTSVLYCRVCLLSAPDIWIHFGGVLYLWHGPVCCVCPALHWYMQLPGMGSRWNGFQNLWQRSKWAICVLQYITRWRNDMPSVNCYCSTVSVLPKILYIL